MKMTGRKHMGKRMTALGMAALLALVPVSEARAAGWIEQKNGDWKYQREDGSYIADGFTPDGYFIDGTGIWKAEYDFLGMTLKNTNTFLTPARAGSFLNWERDMTYMMSEILDDLDGVRGIELSEQEVGLYAIYNNTSRELLSFYKAQDGESYVVSLKCPLNTTKASSTTTRISSKITRTTTVNAAWYDYQVLIGLLSRVSRTGPKLADALYSSWVSTNAYGLERDQWVAVGDALVKYEAANGEGLYYIKANPGLVY